MRASPLRLPDGALVELARKDPKLGALIDRVGPFRLEIGKSESHLGALVRSIVYQQLSGKAAATIHGRLRDALLPDWPPRALPLLALDDERLRACGLSRQKIASVRDLCERVQTGRLTLDEVDAMDDAAIIEQLVEVRGIGVWSAQMFLLFHLGRLDVWPTDDLGVRKAVKLLYGKRELPDRVAMKRVGERFRPYCSVASWYLWRLLDLGEDPSGW